MSASVSAPFAPEGLAALEAAYPDAPARLSHALADHPLFALERLAVLADALPERQVEWNRGDLAIGMDPGAVPQNGLTPGATVRSIETNGSWMVLKNVEADPDYAALLSETLAALAPAVAPQTGAMVGAEGFVFLSSPGSVTPFHMDPEHNVLCQLRGTKTMRIYEPEGIVAPEAAEAFHAGAHRNLAYEEGFDARSERFDLRAGEAVHVPLTAPHWVKNGEAVSVSFSVTWRSALSARRGDLHRMNGWLRARGLAPRAPGGPADAAKLAGFRALRRLRLA